MDTILGKLATGETLSPAIEDRRRHIYIIGKTGTGKSTLLYNLMTADLRAGRGFALLDPHGDLAPAVANSAPKGRNDIVYIDPADLDHSVGFNPLQQVSADRRHLVATQIVSSFKAVWGESWGPRMQYILTQSLRLLLDTPGSTLLGLPRLLHNSRYRKRLLENCQDEFVRSYWRDEFDNYTERFRQEAISPIENKIGALLSSPAIRHVLGQKHSTINISHLMDTGRVMILNLAKGRLGEEAAHLLGALFATAFAQAAERRTEIAEEDRRDFSLFVDEFQSFATDSFGTVLSESRKWRLSLVLGHQFLSQTPESLQDAVLGNVGTIIAFRTGAKDARVIGPELGLGNDQALTDLSNYHAWIKLTAQGVPSEPKELRTLPPTEPEIPRLAAVQSRTRARHTRSRGTIEEAISAFLRS